MSSAMAKVPVIPSPAYQFTAAQIKDIQSSGTSVVDDGDGSSTNSSSSASTTSSSPVGHTSGTTPSNTAGTYTEFDGPHAGDLTTGTNPETLPAGANNYTNFINNLTKVLGEAQGGAWMGNPSNANIQLMIKTTGVPAGAVLSPNRAWCATFVAYMLKISGMPFTVNGSTSHVSAAAGDYRTYGQGMDIQNHSTWRKGDVMVMGRGGGKFHVAFLWGLNVPADKVMLLGGNQGSGSYGNVTISGWYPGALSGSNAAYKVMAVRRAWSLTDNLNTQIAGPDTSTTSSQSA